MKKIAILSLMLFAGSMATEVYAAANGIEIAVNDDKKKKKKKKKGSCCEAKTGEAKTAEGKGSCCAKKTENK